MDIFEHWGGTITTVIYLDEYQWIGGMKSEEENSWWDDIGDACAAV